MQTYTVTDPEQTQALGQHLAENCLQPGDLLILSGELGAGKTTFTQGLARGLGVAEPIFSPTYIVARQLPGRIPLVHADAYRIRDLADLETLDLDATLAESVTVIEWGAGLTEELSDERLEVEIRRPVGGSITAAEDGSIDLSVLDDGTREILFTPIGGRWAGADLSGLATANTHR
ncbi:MAG: tRNA (adenosine(37)-N6)-threonylcarbamoyltransferase complex ATPase subunit type 1 TsaE [Varibaculum sp.]|nr:tRNA (adenosine(37)-N6)-threonylcarbamoyltransferase complex ATPase subunit type 1 TsaE [Varibaculum sp.]